MRLLILLSTTLFLHSMIFAGDKKYPVSEIPPELLKKANVVKRMEDIRYEFINTKEAIFSRKVVLTILNENGNRYASMVVGYDKLRKVTSMEGALYDALGNLIKRTKNKDILDYSDINEISLYDDNRVKVHDFGFRSYPYTVEYDVEMKFSTTYGFPDWKPLAYEGLSVEESSYTLITPETYQVRFKAFNYSNAPQTSLVKNNKLMTWMVKGLPVLERPFASPVLHELTPVILFAPSEFEMEGYKGNASTWQGLGKFSQELNQGRDKLPENMIQKVKELTAGIVDDKEKVRVLYQYLQQNTRYISIQLGIGSLQPFEASFVAQKGYGDCKALSNYMFSLLKAAGIKSCHALVNAGRDMEDRDLVEDFPSHQFNHMVIFVPFVKDTIWLECTSQTDAPGYMGGFAGNRKVLAITDEGGQLVNTPTYGINENTQVRKIEARLLPDGSLDMKVMTSYAGLQQDHLQYLQASLSKDKIKEMLQENLELASYEIVNFKYEEEKKALPILKEQLEIKVNNYANITGKRLFIVPNILNPGGAQLSDEIRKFDFVFDESFHHEVSEEIEIPEGYEMEALPAAVELKTKYGTYSSSSKLVGNKIIYNRVREQFCGRFPPSENAAITQFFSDIFQSDRSRMVLVKKS